MLSLLKHQYVLQHFKIKIVKVVACNLTVKLFFPGKLVYLRQW